MSCLTYILEAVGALSAVGVIRQAVKFRRRSKDLHKKLVEDDAWLSWNAEYYGRPSEREVNSEDPNAHPYRTGATARCKEPP